MDLCWTLVSEAPEDVVVQVQPEHEHKQLVGNGVAVGVKGLHHHEVGLAVVLVVALFVVVLFVVVLFVVVLFVVVLSRRPRLVPGTVHELEPFFKLFAGASSPPKQAFKLSRSRSTSRRRCPWRRCRGCRGRRSVRPNRGPRIRQSPRRRPPRRPRPRRPPRNRGVRFLPQG